MNSVKHQLHWNTRVSTYEKYTKSSNEHPTYLAKVVDYHFSLVDFVNFDRTIVRAGSMRIR